MTLEKNNTDDTSKPGELFSVARAKDAVWAIVALRPVRSALGAIALLVLVRNIDEADFGAYQVYYSIIGLLSTVASLGISNTVARYLPEYVNKGDFGLAKRLVQMASRLRLFSNILILAILWLFWTPLSALLNIEQYADSYLVFSAVAVTFFQTSLLVTTLSSFLLQKRTLLVQTVFAAAKIIGYLLAIEYGLTVAHALLVDLVAFILLWLGLRIVYHHQTPSVSASKKFSRAEAKRIARYSFFYNFNDMGQFAVGKRVDNFFIASMINAASAGAYGLTTRMLEIVRGFVPDRLFLDVIRPMFFTLDPSTEAVKVSHYFQLLVKSNYVFMLPTTAVIIVANNEIFDVVFGGKFEESSAVLAWVFLFATITAFDKPLRLVAQLRERAAIQFIAKLFGIYNVLALLVLIPPYGLVGAAIATGSTDILVKLFIWWFVRDHASFSGMGRFFVISIAFWAIYGVVTSFGLLAIADPFWRLTFALVVALLWWFLYLRLPLLTATEAATISKTFRTRYRVWFVRLGLLKAVR